jgi:hypothetical protein
MIFGNFNADDFDLAASPSLAVTLLVLYLLMVTIVLLNLLIAGEATCGTGPRWCSRACCVGH